MSAQGGGDVACPAGSTTTVLSIGGNNTTVLALGTDTFSPNVDITLAILLGATPPTALVVSYNTVGGPGNIDTYSVAPATLVANATLVIGITLIGPASKLTWQTATAPIIQVDPTGQAVTVKNVGSRGIFSLYQGGP